MYIESFLKYITLEKRYSKHTVSAYEDDLNSFVSFQEKSNPHFSIVDDVNYQLVRAWIVHLSNSGLSNRSINRKITGVKRFYKYLLSVEVMSQNPFDNIISPKTTKRLPSFVKESEINYFLQNYKFGNNFVEQRDRLVLEILYCTGIRLSELINLKEDDINIVNKIIKVTGKRNKQRLVPFPESMLLSLNDYLIEKKHNGFINKYILVTNKDKKAYPNLIYRIVNKYLSFITTIEQKSPHVLRHTYATHLLNNGADLNAIKELLGHANLSATQVYTHNTFKKINNIYKQAHPRA